MTNPITQLLKRHIPTGYEKQMKFYKQNLERLVNDPTSKTSLNNLIGTLILMCYEQTEKDLNDLVEERLVAEETLESEVNELVYAFNVLTDLNDYDKEQQSKRILFSYLIALNISEMIKLFPIGTKVNDEITTLIKLEDE
ncbi:hypothetical protein B5723_14520 [Mammaliicoccus sciuri]|uniref:hypothetical protein n=1 Tax=Mammaliicoccus sciuri TaxID=1296 RepID=UPI000A03AF54|nr:hypothetical protein [Mammaliicoccus sciuri]ORI00674.1 hypothetical protein B5723_14520 [Mammaliicoccus sciuri]